MKPSSGMRGKNYCQASQGVCEAFYWGRGMGGTGLNAGKAFVRGGVLGVVLNYTLVTIHGTEIQ